MNKNNLVKWALFFLLALIWGSSFILMKEGLKGLNAYQVASLRIFSAGIILLPFLGKALKAVPKKKFAPIILSGFLGTFFPAFFFCIAETKIDSSLAGVLNALTPICTLAIGMAFFKLKIGWLKWVGMLLGLCGMVILLLGGSQQISANYLGYTLFVLLATVCYGLNVNVANRYFQEFSPLHIVTIAFTALIIPTVFILAFTGFFSNIDINNQVWIKSASSSILLGVGGSCLASVIFYTLLKKAGPVFASMVTYGIPFVAFFWGFIAGEAVTLIQLSGLVVILLGVRMVNK
jgi:drug/metabolite transporter (DMT)-like permease